MSESAMPEFLQDPYLDWTEREGVPVTEDFVRIDWRGGCMFAPPDQMFHQHFNTGTEPTRYMATALGNSRYPFTARNRAGKIGVQCRMTELPPR